MPRARAQRLVALIRAAAKTTKPWYGRIAGVVAGMLLSWNAAVFGAAVGFLLGTMIDSLRFGADSGDSEPQDSPSGQAHAQGLSDSPAPAESCAQPPVDPAALRRQFRLLYKKSHPDAPGGSAEAFMRVRAVYEQLELRGKTINSD